MQLLIASYHVPKAEGNITASRQLLTEQDQMLRLPTEYSRNIDMESICTDLPMLEPLSDDDVLFGEYQDHVASDLEEQFRLSSFQRRQSYQFDSPSPENTYNVRRTSPTRASIQFGKDFGMSSPGFGTPESSRRPQLASMPEDDQEQSDYMTTESDTPVREISEDRDSFTSLQESQECHHSSRQHVYSERARSLKRRSTMDTIDANSLRWSSQRDWEAKQYVSESIAKERLNPGQKRQPILHRGNTQPNLFGTHAPNRIGSPMNSRKFSSVPKLPLDGRNEMPLQFQTFTGSKSPTSPRSPSSPRSGLMGSPLTSRRASAAAAAAAAFTKHPNHLRRVADMV